MSKPFVIEPEAEFDRFEAFDYYEHQREGLGQDFILCFEAATEAIAERPRSLSYCRQAYSPDVDEAVSLFISFRGAARRYRGHWSVSRVARS